MRITVEIVLHFCLNFCLGFYATPSTTGKALFDLISTTLTKMDLDLSKIVGQGYDGASNMSGQYRGLATLMKEVAPKSLYVHCYGHLLNLAIQGSIISSQMLRNHLGVIQAIYNFIEGSPKRHSVFKVQVYHFIAIMQIN